MAINISDDMAIDMDNTDDLFGDSTAGLLSETSPPPKELLERVDELRSGGCHQSVVWSRYGNIASISPNGCLELQGLRVNPRDGSWDLSEPTLVPHVGTSSLTQVPLQHLSWSPNGFDLAAIDAAGRVAMFTALVYRNKAQACRNVMQDSIDELHAVAGSMWLNLMPGDPRSPVLHSMAVKTSSQGYRYEAAGADAFGPSLPLNHALRMKSAFMCVTTTGLIRLFWPQDPYSWQETNAEIESIVSSDDLITHASLCADQDRTLLLAFATSNTQLRVVRIAIHWTIPPMPQQNGKEQPPQAQKPPTGASIRVTHLASTNWMDSNAENSYLSTSTPALSHLRILSPCRTGRPEHVLPTILTVRTLLPNNVPFYQETQSLIDRWEVKATTPQIHQAFKQLSARRDSVGSKKTTSPTETFFLKKADGMSSKKVITWMDAIQLDRIAVLGHSDGSIELRFRDTLQNISSEGGVDRFRHLMQAGFRFDDVEPALCGTLSPCGVASAYKTSDGKLKWKGLQYTGNDMSSAQADTHYEAFIAGLTMPALIMSQFSMDDVVAVASQFKGLRGRHITNDLVSEMARNTKLQCDYIEHEHTDGPLRNGSIPIIFGLRLSLGYKGEGAHRDFGSTSAWMVLQLRNCVNMMSVLAREFQIPDRNGRIQKVTPALSDPEALREIVGTVRYSLDLMAYIIDSLIHPNDPSEFDETFTHLTLAEPLDLNALNVYLYSTRNVAVHLLLSSTSRGMLMAVCKLIHKLDYTARIALAASRGNDGTPARHLTTSLRSALESIAQLTDSSVVPYSKFLVFVTKTAGHCKEAYSKAGLSGTKERIIMTPRNAIETQIIFGAPLPEQSAYAISKLFHEELPALKEEIDPAKLFFHDYSVLNMPLQDRGTNLPYAYLKAQDKAEKEKLRQKYVRYRVKHTVDVFQRKMVELGNEPETSEKQVEGQGKRKGRRWRRCVKCGAVMEEVQSKNPHVIEMVKRLMRCHCSGYWTMMTGKKIIP